MEKEYNELIKQYPFLQQIVESVEILSQRDKRHWNNTFEEDFSKCLQVLEILKENKLIN